jgi:hypothetical protein
VLRMRHTFESLGYQSGFYLSQLFSSTRNNSSSSSLPSKQSPIPIRPPAPLYNWAKGNFHLQLLCFLHPISKTLPDLDFHKLKMRPICSSYLIRLKPDSKTWWPESMKTTSSGRMGCRSSVLSPDVLMTPSCCLTRRA